MAPYFSTTSSRSACVGNTCRMVTRVPVSVVSSVTVVSNQIRWSSPWSNTMRAGGVISLNHTRLGKRVPSGPTMV
jgi:hypothetical protein